MTTIRGARRAERERLRAIEVAAGAAFATIGMPEIASAEPPGLEVLGGYIEDGRAWVAADADGVAVAYVLVDVVDGCAHVEQVSVHPSAAGRGVGRALLDHVGDWAARRSLGAVTLTTFREVPWNAPYYERCGFRAVPPAAIGPELRALQDHEAALGLDPAARVAMRREVTPEVG